MGKIPRLLPYFLAKIGSFSSRFNVQSKSINLNFGHFSLIFGQNTKAIALLLAKIGSFSSLFNVQSKSINFNFGRVSLIYGQNTKAIALLFVQIGSFSSLFNVQSKSSNLNVGHFSLIFGQHAKAIALLFGQIWLIFITFQCAIKINQFQFRSFFANFWATYQGYSLTFRPKLAHFHHFSMCNQIQSMSMSVILCSFLGKIPRL